MLNVYIEIGLWELRLRHGASARSVCWEAEYISRWKAVPRKVGSRTFSNTPQINEARHLVTTEVYHRRSATRSLPPEPRKKPSNTFKHKLPCGSDPLTASGGRTAHAVHDVLPCQCFPHDRSIYAITTCSPNATREHKCWEKLVSTKDALACCGGDDTLTLCHLAMPRAMSHLMWAILAVLAACASAQVSLSPAALA